MRQSPLTAACLNVTIALMLLVTSAATAAWLQPVHGTGYFEFTCDAVSMDRGDGSLDVVVMVSVPHRNLVFENDAGMYRSRVQATVTLRSLDGSAQRAQSTHRLSSRNQAEAESIALSQTFLVVLEDVDAEVGTLEVRLDDLQRRRPGLQYLATGEKAFAVATGDWHALPLRETRGLAIGDAVFLAHAPIRDWATSGRPTKAGQGGPWDFVNPQRRFGLETPAVQLYMTLAPPRRVEDRARAAQRPILARIESDELDFALVDTIITTPAVRQALAAGRPAAVYWEMDAGGLPPGRYRLGLAPVDDVGRSLLTTFDVVWSLDQLVRTHDDLLGEGRTVLLGADLSAFETASRVEQSLILDRFWKDRDPTPEDPFNEARAKFYQRMKYVRSFLGGFDARGALDERGRIYLLLGEPDEVREEAMPMNENAVVAARDLVFDRFQELVDGSTGTSPWSFGDYVGGNSRQSAGSNLTTFVPYTYMADIIAARNRTSPNTPRFLYWGYDEGGDQLFLNSYTGLGSGLRFFFVDQNGMGDYKLETSNTRAPAD